MKRATRWAILVIWKNGQEDYVKQGLSDVIATFSRADAIEQTKFMKIGMDGDCQSINIVPAPKRERELLP